MPAIPRDVKNALRTIKAYCLSNQQNACTKCDICYLLRNVSPAEWDIELLDLETNCQYSKQCTQLVLAKIDLHEALREKYRLIADNEVLKVTNTVLTNYLDKKVPSWRTELGETK